MLRFVIGICCLSVVTALYAGDSAPVMPTYPKDKPTHQTLADYYKSLSKYYEALSRVYAKKAAKEEEDLRKTLKPSEIVNSKPFNGTNAGLGLVMNTGDTSSQNFNGTALIIYNPNKAWNNTETTTYQYASTKSKGTTANQFYTDMNSVYNFDSANGIYGDANYTRNTFSGYNYQVNESAGYNRTFYNNRIFTLSGQFGPGLQQNSIESPPSSENKLSGNIKLLSTYNFSDQTNLRTSYGMVLVDQDTLQTFSTVLSTTILDQFALQLNYLVTYASDPQPGKENLNTTTTISLVYNF